MVGHDSFVLYISEDESYTPSTHPTQPVAISNPYTITSTTQFAPLLHTVSTTKTNTDFQMQTNFQTLSAMTCLQLVPALTSEQIRREFTYLMSSNPNLIVNIKNPRRPTLTEQRAAIRVALTQEVAVVHDILLSNINNKNTLIPNISCMLDKMEAQSRQLDQQMTSLTDSLEELKQLRFATTSPVSRTPFSTPSHHTNTISTLSPDTHTTSTSITDTRTTDVQEVLILTDSILNIFDPKKYVPRDQTSQMNITKRNLFKLHEIDVNDFDKYDTVIISSGINDLTKYNYTPDSLYQFVSRVLSRVNPNTKIIFRGLTPTRFDIINQMIYRFNNLMFEFCLELEKNTFYYDPHKFENRHDFLYKHGNGIHISNQVAVFMTMNILNHAQCMFTRNRSFEPWPLRASLQARFDNNFN